MAVQQMFPTRLCSTSKRLLISCSKETHGIPVTATQCAHPAAALTIEASVGRGKGSGISLPKQMQENAV